MRAVNAIIFSAIILFCSCGKSEKQIKEEKEQASNQKYEQFIRENKQIEAVNDKAILDLNYKYNAVSGWDSMEAFTYVFQELFVDNNNAISFYGSIEDISKLDSSCLLTVRLTKRRSELLLFKTTLSAFAIISISKERFAELKKIIESGKHSKEGCFIFNVSKIASSSPIMNEGTEDDLSLTVDFGSRFLIFKGDLVDYYINEGNTGSI